MSTPVEKREDHAITARNKLRELGSPNEIRQQNLRAILEWLYRWGFSTSEIISDLLGRVNRSHARRLAADGWIRPVTTKGYPTYYTLTEKGLNEAIHHATSLLEYKEIDPYRVHLPTLHHDLTTQEVVLSELDKGCTDYLTPRMYNVTGDNALKKIPDAILICPLHDQGNEIEKLGVEVELTPKWNHKLDLFVTDIIDDVQFQRLNRFLIISDSDAVLQRYSDAFRPGNKVPIWEQTSKGKPINTGDTLEIPAWTPDYINFRKLNQPR